MGELHKNETGSALLITLLLMVMLTIVVLTAANVAQTDVELSFNQVHGEQSFYVAEAGVKRAFVSINSDSSWDAGFIDVPFGEGSYSVVVRDSADDPDLGDTVLLIATGEVRGSRSTVEATLVPEPLLPYAYGLFAYDWVTIENSVCTDSWNSDSGSFDETLGEEYGSIGSNGPIVIENNPTIGGDVTTAMQDGITVTGGGEVLGDVTAGGDQQDFSYLISPEQFEWARDNNRAPLGISGSFSYNAGTRNLHVAGGQTVILSSGVYYLNDIRLAQSASLQLEPGAQVQLYLTGDIELRNQAAVNAGGRPIDLMVFSIGTRFAMGQSSIFSGVTVAPNVSFDLVNNTDYYGSLIARSIRLRNNPCFHYDRSLVDYASGYTDKMKQIAWRQLD